MIQSSKVETEAGPVTITWTCPLVINSIRLPEKQIVTEPEQVAPDWLSELAAAIRAYFRGNNVDFHSTCSYFSPSKTLPYLDGERLTPFQRKVYESVSDLAYGEVMSYGQVAAAVGSPRSARAIGGAMGANPFPLLIPCHRVVGANGLGGFSGGSGVELKRRMLALEGVKMG